MYSSQGQIEKYVYKPFLEAAESKIPGIVQNTIAAVSAEIDERLSRRWVVPFGTTPALVAHICSVLAAYRIVGALTSLMDTEAQSDNQWIPLQKQWQKALELLEELAKPGGKVTLPPPAEEAATEGRAYFEHSDLSIDMRGY